MIRIIEGENSNITFPVAIVVSRFNAPVTDQLLSGCQNRLHERGFTDSQITIVKVPGAVEIPVVAQRLAESKQVSAIITLGAVIRGETDHYDYVCQSVTDGCQKVALNYGIPVIFGILTTHNGEQALARVNGEHGNKGLYCADAAIEMVSVLREIA